MLGQILLCHGLRLALHAGRPVRARLHGHHPHAWRVGDRVLTRGVQHRRADAGEAAAHVPERGGPRRDQHLGEAEQEDLRERLLVVPMLSGHLHLLVGRLEHADPYAALGSVLVIPRPEHLVVVRVQRRDQDGRGRGVPGRRRRRREVVIFGFRQYVLLPGARKDLAIHVVRRDPGEVLEDPDLYADPLVRPG